MTRSWVQACHPGPAAAVTVIVTLLAAAAGRSGAGLLLVTAAVLCGQLSVGWSNDARDADRDRRAGRTEKPTVSGALTAAQLWCGALIALALGVLLSFPAAGPIGGSAHVAALLSAWSYNLYFKTTVLSPLPYAVSFALVPAFVTYGLTPPIPPAPWATLACALMGVGAHLANALPDIDSDRTVSAGGLAAVLGPRTTTSAALACLVAALLLLVGHLTLPQPVALAITVVTVGSAVAVAAQGRGAALFRFLMVLAVLAVGLLLFAAGSITG